MSETNAGWILCPSKSLPGKFYYFNVLTGSALWSLNQTDSKNIKKESTFHKITDKAHGYPEPSSLPDESITISPNIANRTQTPNFVGNIPSPPLPTFGQATFPKYVANVEPLIPNIVWTSVPFPMFCPERTKKKTMFDKVTQVSEFERELFLQSSNIPLSKRFKNYEPPLLTFDTKHKIAKPFQKYEMSTPKKKNTFSEHVTESQNNVPKSLIKELSLKLVPKLPTQKVPEVKTVEKPTLCINKKDESPKSSTESPKVDQKEAVLDNLDSSDLRFLLLGKRKSLDAPAAAVEKKKLKLCELKPVTSKKKVTFNIPSETDDETENSNDVVTQEDFIPLTSNQTLNIDAPKSPKNTQPVFLKDISTTPKNTQPPFINDISKTPPPVKAQPPTTPTMSNQPITGSYQPVTGSNQPLTGNNETVTGNKQPVFGNNQQSKYKSTIWYIVVDTDVLLLDYEMIDKIVLSDPKCRLVIPHVVAADIEALCLGDCRGQQRVINARQLTRRLQAPPRHYIVEPRTSGNGNIEVTTDSILNCCMKVVKKNYYVVLITNDPHLKIRATLQNIPSYKLNEIKYGNITPYNTSEATNIKINTSTENIDTKNLYKQTLNLFNNLNIKPDVTTQMTNMKIPPSNDLQENTQNFGLFNFRNPVQKQFFLISDSESDNKDDKLIDVVKPKCMKNVENLTNPDSDGISDISSDVSSLHLKDNTVLRTQNAPRNPFLPQNFEKRFQNPNSVANPYNFKKTIPNEKPVLKPDHEVQEFQKDTLDYNFENTEKVFCSIPIANMKLFKPKNKPEILEKPNTIPLHQDSFEATANSKILSPSQTRINKIIKTINVTPKTQKDNPIPKTKDSTGVFKILKLLPIKNAPRNMSVSFERPTVNDKIGKRTNIDPIDDKLRRFCIKSQNMRQKIKTRIDEWVCSYMQIIEDAMVNILQKNSVCMKNTVAPLDMKDTLNCIKMLYGSHTLIRDIINKLSDLLEKCSICAQGKSKMSVSPEQFMKIFGYGVLLIHSLKIILPHNEEMRKAELRLKVLQINLENNIMEIDPELVKPPSVGRSEVDSDQDEVLPPFLKKKSFVVDYLKKHFKQWAEYKEDLNEHADEKIENHTNFKVLRTCGKNLSLLKLDRTKTMSLSKNNIENEPAKTNDAPKLIRLLENNQLIKPDTIENAKENTTLKEVKNNENSQSVDLFTEENEISTENVEDVPLKKLIDNIDEGNNIESKEKEDLNQEDTLLKENEEKNEPDIVRNMNVIEELDNKKYSQREPLDLDLLDYSEIYEPSVNGNIDFDIYSENNKNTEEINKFENPNNFGLTITVSLLEDFLINPSVSPDSKNNNSIKDLNNTETSNNNNSSETINNDYFKPESENNKNGNNSVESETYTEKDSFGNDLFQTTVDISGTRMQNSDSLIDSYETTLDNSGTQIDNSETPKDNSEISFANAVNWMENSVTQLNKTPVKNFKTQMDNSKAPVNNFKTLLDKSVTRMEKTDEKPPMYNFRIRTDNSKTRLDKCVTRMDNSKTPVNNFNTPMDNSKTHLDKSDTRMDNSVTRMEKTDEKTPMYNFRIRTDNSKTRLDKCVTRMDNSKTPVNNFNTPMDNSKTHLDKSDTRMDNSVTRMEKTDEKTPMYNFRTRMDNSKTRLVNFKTQMDDSKTPINNCETQSVTRMDKTKSAMNNFKTQIDNAVTRMEKTDDKTPMYNIRTRMDNSKTQLDNFKTLMDDSVTHMDNSKTTMNNFKTQMENSKTWMDNSETPMDNSKSPNNDSGTHFDNSETRIDNLDKTAEFIQDQASTNDSGFENDSTYAHSMIKIFLHELSTTFKAIRTFVITFIEEIHGKKLSSKRKDVLHYRASKALEEMTAIIQKLNSIIKRESAEDTVLKRLLRNAGVEATTDKRMTRYRQIVIKCLEQGLILESALKIIVSTTIGDFGALASNAETLNSNIKYFNIFE